jgi:arylsulfatase A-like enzyme
MVENMDENIGRILDRLDALHLAERTLVVFLSDNGPNSVRYGGGLRGRKGSVYEGGTRVPCFMRWKGRLTPGIRIHEPAAHIDLLPTIAGLCGVPVPDGLAIDGRSLVPWMENPAASWPDRMLFTHQCRTGSLEFVPGAERWCCGWFRFLERRPRT